MQHKDKVPFNKNRPAKKIWSQLSDISPQNRDQRSLMNRQMVKLTQVSESSKRKIMQCNMTWSCFHKIKGKKWLMELFHNGCKYENRQCVEMFDQ
jgi:hypothetical protein